MTLSMYQASTPVFIRGLKNLAEILRKAEADADARKISHDVFIQARLAPDMFPLVRQVQIATDGVKGCAARLAGIEIPVFEDTETTFAQLQERIAKTIAFLESVPASQIDGTEEKSISFKTHRQGSERHFLGLPYLTSYVLPNFYFHSVAAYLILRHNGVQVGKMDFLGNFQ